MYIAHFSTISDTVFRVPDIHVHSFVCQCPVHNSGLKLLWTSHVS